jgi:hypothetical protein
LLGFIIYLNDAITDLPLFSRDNLLKIALFDLNFNKNNKDIYEKYNFDCIEIRDSNNSDDDDDEFDYVDDLLNSLLIYKWPVITTKENSQIDTNAQEFENLLMNLQSMREEATKLSGNERKDYAEKVVMNFLNIIGANDDEDLNHESDLDD